MKAKFHLIGIGGISMSSIARILSEKNHIVQGSDTTPSQITDELKYSGIEIFKEHNKKNISSDCIVIYSSAIKDTNVEKQEALKKNLSLKHRSEIVNQLTKGKKLLVVTGTHGKSSTTTILTHILKKASYDPSFMIGAYPNEFPPYAIRQTPFFVLEADESDGSFLKTDPFATIVTTLDDDHLDFYKTPKDLKLTFEKWLNKKNNIVWHYDNALQLKKGTSYGLSKNADSYAFDINYHDYGTTFSLSLNNTIFKNIFFPIVGEDQLLNAVAAFTLANKIGIDSKTVISALASFRGVKKRLEHKGTFRSVDIFEDYAHHPTSIKSTISTLKKVYPKRRIIAVVEPHRYSRFSMLYDKYLNCFVADLNFILPIYGASEKKQSIDLKTFSQKANINYIDKVSKVISALKPYDIIVVMGAGNTGAICTELSKNIKKFTFTIIHGGQSSEHDISIQSHNVFKNYIDNEIYNTIPILIDKDGYWQKNRALKINESTIKTLQKSDIVFSLIHGKNGEDGKISAFLDLLNIPYIGTNPLSGGLSHNKIYAKIIVQNLGIKTAPFTFCNSQDWQLGDDSVLDRVNKLNFPLYVKGANLGSSIGIFKINNMIDARKALDQASILDSQILIEENIADKKEVQLSVSNEEIYDATILNIKKEFYDFDSKYSNSDQVGKTIYDSKYLPELKIFTNKIYKIFNLKGIVRIDFLISESTGIWFSEINNVPGFTKYSVSVRGLNDKIIKKAVIEGLYAHKKRQYY